MNPFARSHASVAPDPDDTNDLVALIPARTFTLGPPRPKAVVEAEQMRSFVAAWCNKHDVAESEVVTTAQTDGNEHDFDMTVHGRTYEVELTALLSRPLRDERRRILAVGRAVHAGLVADPAVVAALNGQDVLLRDEASTAMPATGRAVAATAAAIESLVSSAATSGAVAQEAQLHLGTEDGIAVFLLPPDADSSADLAVHVSTANTSTTLSATRTAVVDAVTGKDKKSRKYVVVIAGDLSNDGETLPVEVAEYELVAYGGAAAMPELRHVEEAWLHLAGTTGLIRLV